jgi:ABC transport system ATP-binding/permease protein
VSAILTVQALEKRYGSRRVLNGASFAVHERDRIGMIGANGAGKSTLLKMIVHRASGGDDPALVPDAGLITWKRDLVLEYVAQEPELDNDAPVNAELARPSVPEYEIATVAGALRLPPMDALIGTLSIGERRRVALAHALLGKPDVLALDEPTNHLDARTVEWLEVRLANWNGALICVTHDRYFLDRVSTRILEVDRGKVHSYEGDYEAFLEIQAGRFAIEDEAEYQRSSFIRRELDWIRRGPKARGVKAKARIGRFDTAVAAAPTTDEKRAPTMQLELPTGPRLGSTIVELHGVSRAVGGPNQKKTLFENLELVMKPGDRIGIVGPNGVGKTTLIKTILGLEPPDTGTVVVGSNTRPAYFEQGRSELRDELTVLEEVGDGYDFVELPSGKIHVRGFLKMLAIPDSVADTKVGQLSGGERNRVQLARLLRRGGNLLVLDEPTNDLDLQTLGALEEGLASFPGCALIVSHDRWFLDRVATAILAFEGDGKVTLYEGSYSFYVERRPSAAAEKKAANSGRAQRSTQPPAPRKLTFKERAELGGIEEAIAVAETGVRELEATLSDPAVFKDRAPEVPAIIASLDTARLAVEKLFARWQELDAIAASER